MSISRTRQATVSLLAVALSVSVALWAGSGTAAATAKPTSGTSTSPPATKSTAPVRVPLAAGDQIAIAVPGANGIDVLVANEGAQAAGWSQLAHLGVAGWDAPQWTDYACVTGDGRFMAVTFAPVAFLDAESLRDAGAPAAVVDLSTGASWLVPERVALKYHTPGCGLGDDVVFSRTPKAGATDLFVVNAAQHRITRTIHTGTEVTGSVPTARGVVAAEGNRLVSVGADGTTTTRVPGQGQLFDLRPNSQGGVDYLARLNAASSAAYRWVPGRTASRLASGPLTDLDLLQGRRGHNRLVGQPAGHPTSIDVLRTGRLPDAVSLDGSLVVDSVDVPGITAATTADGSPVPRVRTRTSSADLATQVTADRSVAAGPLATAAERSSTFRPLTALPTAPKPTVSVCSIPPLDPGTQVVQTSDAQLEWAANRAVRGLLTTARPANWHKNGLGAYTPATVFPLPGLTGGGRIPVQVLLGVLAQESNFSQASWHALPGVPGDPLIANYFGAVYDAKTGLILGMNPASSPTGYADCGYGAGQITTNMLTTDTTWPAATKREVATDYEVNLAAAASLLASDWNLLKANGIIANTGDPKYIENWYMVLWIYNSGFHAATGTAPWGLGWTNNPVQNDYNPKRGQFLQVSWDDASHPGDWPYQEKVLGWAGHSQQDFITGGLKFTGSAQPLILSGDYSIFCTAANNCSSASTSTGYCLSSDRTTCWWHGPVAWLAPTAGTTENPAAYVAGAAEPTVTNPYPPACTAAASAVQGTPGTTALPSSAVVVDELANTNANLVGCPNSTSKGSFALSYGTDGAGYTTAAIDTHQLGVGYGGHIYFSHTVDGSRNNYSGYVTTTGTWTPPTTVKGWQRVWVHIPANGADSPQANYVIRSGTDVFHRVVDQRWNKNSWIDLGSFNLAAGTTVSLSNGTFGDWSKGQTVDIAWDAVAFSASAKPAVSYVDLGDSYQAGEGDEPYYANADNGNGATDRTDACHRSPQAYGPLLFADEVAKHPGNDEFHFLACSGAEIHNVIGTSVADDQHWTEEPQLLTGWLDQNTTLVTVGIGGNDARFADIISACFETLDHCLSGLYHLGSDPTPLTTSEPQIIKSLAAPLAKTYAAIRTAAPNAKVIVVGYPYVISLLAPTSNNPTCHVLDGATLSWFQQMGDLMNQVTATAAANAGFTFVNPVNTFSSHEACAPSDWINGIIPHSSTGSGGATPGSGSFHPKATGHQAEEKLIKPLLP